MNECARALSSNWVRLRDLHSRPLMTVKLMHLFSEKASHTQVRRLNIVDAADAFNR